MKWRGPVLHRFVVALVDDAPAVRQLGRYLLEDALATKAFVLTYNHVVEALFSLNNCPERLAAVSDALASQATHEVAGNQLVAAAGTEACRLDGAEARDKRMVIYRELLSRMSAEHRFSCSAKLCVDVLGAVIDGALPLDSCQELIRDVLLVLACKEIQVSSSKELDAEGEEPGTQAAASAQVAAAKGRLMGSMMRKHLLEQVVPVLAELHRQLTASRHPLLGALMQAAAALLKEHKGEVRWLCACGSIYNTLSTRSWTISLWATGSWPRSCCTTCSKPSGRSPSRRAWWCRRPLAWQRPWAPAATRPSPPR